MRLRNCFLLRSGPAPGTATVTTDQPNGLGIPLETNVARRNLLCFDTRPLTVNATDSTEPVNQRLTCGFTLYPQVRRMRLAPIFSGYDRREPLVNSS
jgi:hypothetical protein